MRRSSLSAFRLFGFSAFLLLASCSPLSPQGGSRGGFDRPARSTVSPAALDGVIERSHQRLEGLTGDRDLIDALYFTWMDQPYRRATLAAAIKGLAVLERERTLRQSGNGAMSDADLDQLIAWQDAALGKPVPERERAGFHPQRLRCDGVRLARADGDEPADAAPSRFAFVDRTTATRARRPLGEFDLLTCLGLGAYALPERLPLSVMDRATLGERAASLGVGLFAAAGRGDKNSVTAAFEPRPLAWWLEAAGPLAGPDLIPAGLDPPDGESWGESLARRRLIDAVSGRGAIVVGWMPARGRKQAPERSEADDIETTRLTMWLHALAGQRLGVIEGWRDLRDGSRLPYPALTTRPWQVEAIALTGLDLLYAREAVVGLAAAPPPAAVIVDRGCLRPGDDNRWSPEAAAVFEWLIGQQLCFDVLPATSAGRPGELSGYRVLIVATAGNPSSALSEHLKAAEQGGARCIPSAGATVLGRPDGLSAAPDGSLLEHANRTVACESDGRVAGECLILDDRAHVAVLNLAPSARTLKLRWGQAQRPASLRDVLSGETVTAAAGLRFAPHQVRLFAAGR